MSGGIVVTRPDLDAAGLRRAASKSSDARASRRMLALALILEGQSRTQAAEQCGMDRQTLRDWVHRYNDEGLAGLSDRRTSGAPCRLSAEQQAELAQVVRAGPNFAEHGVVRWRRSDLSRLIAQRFGVTLQERSVGALLYRLGFRRLSARPRHPGHDAEAQSTHKKTLPIWLPPRSPSTRVTSRSSSGGRTRRVSASKAP